MDTPGGGKNNDEDDFSSDKDQEMDTDSVEEEYKEEKVKSTKLVGLDVEKVFAEMPKTDKQKRHEKRIKAMQQDKC